MEQKPSNKIQTLAIPIAIVIAGAFIAVALYMTGGSNAGALGAEVPEMPSGDLEAMAPITGEDHIRGNPNAPVKIVEYSDTECPFCKKLHPTLQQVIGEYGDQVAWVYRHFPLDQLHPKARKEAEATECAAELGGNDGFWKYLDRLFEVTPANDGLDPAELPRIAQYVGLDVARFNECLSSGKYAQKIEGQVQDAIATGGTGTPWNIVVAKNGEKYPLSGAQPYEAWKQVIDIALK